MTVKLKREIKLFNIQLKDTINVTGFSTNKVLYHLFIQQTSDKVFNT